MWTPEQWYQEARVDAQTRAEQIRGMADFWMRTLEREMPDVSGDEITRLLQVENRKRLDAMPPVDKYPELRGMRELIEASWRGIQDGAQLDDTQLASHCGASFYLHRYLSNNKKATGCTYVYFPTSDYGPILANNLDALPDHPLLPPEWPAISEHLIIGGVSSGVYLDEESPEIFPVPVLKMVARYCRTTDEAVEMLQRYNHFWGPTNLIIIDHNQRVAMVEKTACRMAVRFSPDGFAFITAMTQEDPELQAYVADRRTASLQARNLPDLCDDTVYWAAQDKRRVLMNELLEEARQNPTLESLQAMIQFRDAERGNVASNGEPVRPGAPDSYAFEHTIKTQIWLLEEGKAQWWAYDREQSTPSWKNRQPDVTFNNLW